MAHDAVLGQQGHERGQCQIAPQQCREVFQAHQQQSAARRSKSAVMRIAPICGSCLDSIFHDEALRLVLIDLVLIEDIITICNRYMPIVSFTVNKSFSNELGSFTSTLK
jgi:hypothetical protein